MKKTRFSRSVRLIVFALLPALLLWLAAEAFVVAGFSLGLIDRARYGFPLVGDLLIRAHPYRPYVYAPGRKDRLRWASTNSHGLRGPEFPTHKPPRTIRILCLGGSTTYCNGAMTDSHTYPAHMEQFLRERCAGRPFAIEVINAGHPAYVSLDSLVLFETQGLDFEPDIAVFHHGINDAWVAAALADFETDYSHARRTFHGRRAAWEVSPLLTFLFRRATTAFNPWRPNPQRGIVDYINVPLRKATAEEYARMEQGRARELADALERNLITFAAVARGNGVIPVVSTMSHKPMDTLYYRVLEAGNARIRQVAAERSIPLIDFERLLPWNADIYFDWCHLRDAPQGLEAKGRLFADELLRLGLIDEAARHVE
jgi:hypothetical protein